MSIVLFSKKGGKEPEDEVDFNYNLKRFSNITG